MNGEFFEEGGIYAASASDSRSQLKLAEARAPKTLSSL